MSKDNLGITQQGGKFIVTKNGQPINLPKTDGQSIVTEFDNREDAQRYMDILSTLFKKQTKKVKNV